MPIYSASSRSPQRIAVDGTTNVYCETCGELISRVAVRMARAKCALCARLEEGMPLTPEAIVAYELSKAPYKDVTMIAVQQEQQQEPNKKRRTLRSMGNGLMSALGFKNKEEMRPPPSKQVAKSKKVGPLFGNDDISKL